MEAIVYTYFYQTHDEVRNIPFAIWGAIFVSRYICGTGDISLDGYVNLLIMLRGDTKFSKTFGILQISVAREFESSFDRVDGNNINQVWLEKICNALDFATLFAF